MFIWFVNGYFFFVLLFIISDLIEIIEIGVDLDKFKILIDMGKIIVFNIDCISILVFRIGKLVSFIILGIF